MLGGEAGAVVVFDDVGSVVVFVSTWDEGPLARRRSPMVALPLASMSR